MAEDDEREAPEITSEENPIEEDELELSLGLRPIHARQSRAVTSQNFPEFSDANPNPSPNPNPATSFSKRDVQALRRQEAKRKRDLKRKASINTDGNSGDSPAGEDVGNCRKSAKLDAVYWPPASWSWNPADGGGGFRAYQGQNGKITSGWQNVDGENRQSISSGSSSGISDNYQSTSGPGVTSSDVGSQSSHPYSQASPPAMRAANPSQLQATSQQAKSPEGAATSSSPNSHSQTSVEDGPASDKGAVPPTQTPSAKVETGKPPKPKAPTANQQKLMVGQMPCVSVTGNGPNGKTVTGFLYRYTTAEVSIVCVCHGTSFSPAGFVEHAGGVNVEHPLRHIRVVPFALS